MKLNDVALAARRKSWHLRLVQIPEASPTATQLLFEPLSYGKDFRGANMLQTIQLSHMPPGMVLYVTMYRDVKNAAFLRQQLLDGNADFEYAFIDASMILSTTHILAASFRAMNDYLHGRLKSRNVHSEIVFALSPNNNIGEAFRKFGIGDTSSDLLVIKVATSPSVTLESVRSHLQSAVEGKSIEFNNQNLEAVSDLVKVRKAYKIASNMSSKGQSKALQSKLTSTDEAELASKETKELETAILGAIALRGAT